MVYTYMCGCVGVCVWGGVCVCVFVHNVRTCMYMYGRRQKKVPQFYRCKGRPFKKKTGGERVLNG